MRYSDRHKMKGAAMPLALSAVLILAALGAAYGFFTWAEANKATAKAQMSIVDENGGQVVSQRSGEPPEVSGSSGGTLYSYAGIQPQMNFLTQDQGGTARNPTWYLYNKDPATIPGKTWASEREWTDTSGEYFDSGTATSGKLTKQLTPGTRIWAHGSLSAYEDQFVSFVVPSRGDLSPGDASSSSIGLDALGSQKIVGTYDTTAWTSSVLNLSVGQTNATDARYAVTTTRTVTSARKVKLDRIMLNNLSDFNTLGLRRLSVVLTGRDVTQPDSQGKYPVTKSVTIPIYNKDGADYSSYSSATLGRTYDSTRTSGHKELVRSIGGADGDVISIQIVAYLDVDTDGPAGKTNNGDTIADDFLLEDVEGNNLILQDLQT